MENLYGYLLPALLTASVLRAMLLPLKWFWKLAIHSCGGFLCLWLLNTVAPFTGIAFPMNAVTVLVAGVMGLPGIGILALLAM